MSAEPHIIEERHESLYYPDGDIVISATASTRADVVQLFRVDKVFLARHSTVFRGMLSLDNVATNATIDVNEQYDDVPRVHLSDNAEDVAGLLLAIYDLGKLPLVKLHPDNPLNVTGIMKLEVKYEVEVIRREIIRRIEADWPLSLDEWLDRDREMQKRQDYFKFPEPASAIRFAMEFNCPRILPAAFYELARAPELLEWEPEHKYDRPARWSVLDAADFKRVVTGQKTIASNWQWDCDDIVDGIVRLCPENLDADDGEVSTCVKTMRSLLDKASESLRPANDPLRVFLSLKREVKKSKSKWCRPALFVKALNVLHTAAKDCWDTLPSVLEQLLRACDGTNLRKTSS